MVNFYAPPGCLWRCSLWGHWGIVQRIFTRESVAHFESVAHRAKMEMYRWKKKTLRESSNLYRDLGLSQMLLPTELLV